MRQVRGPDATSIMPSEGQTGGSATQKYGPPKVLFPASKLPFRYFGIWVFCLY